VATFSLCLLAQAYTLSFALVKRFSLMEDVSVGFLMQIDKLVYLLESPIFVHLRLQLLDAESPSHAPLLKSIYGILLCLPQGDAFRLLNNRLTTVCNLRDNLGLIPLPQVPTEESGSPHSPSLAGGRFALSFDALLVRYDEVLEMHCIAKEQMNEDKHRLQIQVTTGTRQQTQTSTGQGSGASMASGLQQLM
jgi:vacuole morphology and inheritance protein 14